ncbi:esterase-like activity of phytase family protein [Amycolatopsis nigrescens]|uniref:esterase-like activity of phytase family protein n=1 Tax=Amycolatopsis nigrescens TaxID=381445 RepID=UPI0003617822|nr:esterase-like activity of phytase family protein [Amycolatopsis nigrescens]
MTESRAFCLLAGSVLAAAVVTGGVAHAGPVTSADATPVAWPGGSSVTPADAADVFGEDLSGLYQEGNVLWAVQNSGKLWRLLPNGSGGWTPDTAAGWSSGKELRFPGGSGTPDGEGVTLSGSGGGVFVSSERNDDASDTSRTSVLRYDVSGTGSTLSATGEWNLTSDLPPVGANLGFEGISWIPDSSLTGAGFTDASTGAAYDPARYGSHSGGVFFVGVEGEGMVYGYVLEDSGSYTRVASFSSGMSGVMELQWEPQASRLWVVCDDTCDGEHRTMKIDASGNFATTAVHHRPAGMPNLNNEGFALAGVSECAGGSKPVYWADDGNDDGHALRKGTVAC